MRIDNESNLKKNYCDGPDYNRDETGGINLTNFVTEVNTVGYQQNSSEHNTR